MIAEVIRTVCPRQGWEFVVAALPCGPLGHSIDAYRQAVAVRIGVNTAHALPAHVPLVHLPHDRSVLALYRRLGGWSGAVDGTHADTVSFAAELEWHGLEFESELLETIARRAAALTEHARRAPDLRLMLASGFVAEHGDALAELAHRIVDPTLTVGWRLQVLRSRTGVCESAWTADC